MATKVTMPQMGESIFEGTLTKWLKKVGDPVMRDEPLFEISTDKVDSEIPSPVSGILAQIIVPEGKTVQINTVLAVIEESGVAQEGKGTAHSPEVAIARDSEPQAVEPPESPAPLPSFAQEAVVTPSAAREATAPATITQGIYPRDIRTSPLVRRLARENKIDLSAIRGTGLEGRITKDDVLNYLAQRSSGAETPAAMPQTAASVAEGKQEPIPAIAGAEPPPSISPAQSEIPRFAGDVEVVPMTAMRKAIADHMVLSRKTSAHVNTVFEVDMTSIVNLRQIHREEFQRRESISLTYTPFFAKALVENVHEFPVFNASVSGDTIVYKKPVNLGIAVALDTGLIVPVIKDAHLKSLTGLALAIYDLAERARTRRLKPEEVQNGTISMTNPGSFGALFGTPIISQPQVAILGIGGIEKRPVVIQDAIAIRSMVCLSLSFDHRVIDGAVADRFMARLKERLQSWTQWID
jgi:pyruvate dehydrogenase E2 component (dihydrolipoamide acetyltransferase)